MTTSEGGSNNESPRLSFFWFCVGVIGLVALDQFSKWVVYHRRIYTEFAQFFGIEQFNNYNFAFSLPLPAFIMYAIYIIVIGVMTWYLVTHWVTMNFTHRIAWVCILAGSCSNVFERVITGYVKDFIHVLYSYFNLADVYIVVGALLIVFAEKVSGIINKKN